MLPQEALCSCFIFETFSTFLQWFVMKQAESQNFVHLVDDFLWQAIVLILAFNLCKPLKKYDFIAVFLLVMKNESAQ